MHQTLKVIVRPDGGSTVEVDGVVGEACLALTREIEQSLGDLDGRTKKPAFYQKLGGGAALNRLSSNGRPDTK